jgi:hypothetical protein
VGLFDRVVAGFFQSENPDASEIGGDDEFFHDVRISFVLRSGEVRQVDAGSSRKPFRASADPLRDRVIRIRAPVNGRRSSKRLSFHSQRL